VLILRVIFVADIGWTEERISPFPSYGPAPVEARLREKGIPFSIFHTQPVFDRYNALLKEDKINRTPTCVVIKYGQKKVFEGEPDIINALKALP